MVDTLALLKLDAEALFVIEDGHMVRQNDPDGSPAPRLFFTGCAAGNFALVRQDVEASLADELTALAAAEPPWDDHAALPSIAADAAALLGEAGAPTATRTGFTYALPHDTMFASDATIVCSGTPEGDALLARFRDEGMPAPLSEAGFLAPEDFWPPWCVALMDDRVAAIAFAARLGATASEIGVRSCAGFRGKGFAAAVTAAWSARPELKGRALFYGCDQANRSSQRVTQRLGLRRIAGTLHVA